MTGAKTIKAIKIAKMSVTRGLHIRALFIFRKP
jgi:hypothetical protein